jgi:hypothetical protein
VSDFTVITPTGDRPDPFQLCCHFMQRQTVFPKEWIIVDDGEVPTSPPDLSFVKYVRRANNLSKGKHTLPFQLLEAIKHVTTDRVVIFEDDDWYCADYFEQMGKLFETHPDVQLVGQGQAVYYHVPFKKCYPLVNKDRASLCQSAFLSDILPVLSHICKNTIDPFVDLKLWKKIGSKFLLLNHPPMCVGMKGLPGRKNFETMGHKGTHPNFKPDPDLSKLRSYIGNDVVLYEKYTHPSQPTTCQRSSLTDGHRRSKIGVRCD